MALANEAVLLARAGMGVERNKVLMIDWDLEAPGLHEFFRDHLPEHTEKAGIIDLFIQVQKTFSEGSIMPNYEEDIEKIIEQFFFNAALRTSLSEDLWLLKSGRSDDAYSIRVQTFDWRTFFDVHYSFFAAFIRFLEKTYDYTLIDSRTGLTDTSGICTAILPEVLVAVFTPTSQGLQLTEVAKKAVNYRNSSDDLRPLIVYPLASRIDTSVETLNQHWRKKYTDRFEYLFREIYNLEGCELSKYFEKIEIHYVKDLAYGESVAVLERAGSMSVYELPARYNELAQLIIGEYLPWEMPDIPEPRLLTAQDHVAFAKILAGNKEFTRAEKHFQRSLDMEQPQDEKYLCYVEYIQYLRSRNASESIMATYNQMLRQIPEFELLILQDYIRDLLYFGNEHTLLWAERTASLYLKKYPTNINLLILYSQIFEKQGLLEQAEHRLIEAVEAETSDAVSQNDYTAQGAYAHFLLNAKKDYLQAEKIFRQLQELDDEPEGWEANLAQVLLLQGKYLEGKQMLENLLSHNLGNDTLNCFVWFLQLLYFPETGESSIKHIKNFLDNGVRITGKDFSQDIAIATKNSNPHLTTIQSIASMLKDVENLP